MTTTRPPLEAELITGRRKRAGLSRRAAAQAAGISPTRWREVELGISSRATPETLARMAAVVWVTPEELTAIGCPEAAAGLTRLLDRDPGEELRAEARALAERIARSRSLTEGQKRALEQRIMRVVSDNGE